MFAILAERALGPKLYGVFPLGRLEQYLPVWCTSQCLHTVYSYTQWVYAAFYCSHSHQFVLFVFETMWWEILLCFCFPRILACAQISFRTQPSPLRLPPSWPVSTTWLCPLIKSLSGCLGPLISKYMWMLSLYYSNCNLVTVKDTLFVVFLDTWNKWWILALYVMHMWRSTRSWWNWTFLLNWEASGELERRL